MPLSVKLGGAAFVLFVLNYAAVVVWGYPFLYCWGEALLGPLVRPYASLALFALVVVFAGSMWLTGFGRRTLQIGVLLVVVGAIPELTVSLLKLNGSCGGVAETPSSEESKP